MIECLSSEYTTIGHTPSSAITGGQVVAVNDVLGFPISDIAIDQKAELIYKCRRAEVDKVTGVAMNEGDKVYFNVGSQHVTKTTTDVICGIVTKAAASADTKVIIEFDSTLAAVPA